MADTRRPERSSMFDGMLAQTRKQLDDLYRGQRRSGERTPTSAPSTTSDRETSGRTAKPSALLDASSSAAVRRMNERFGSDWRYEITEQRREAGEAIVLCKLTFGKDRAVRTQ